jgi:hypothetical protein
MERPGSAGRRDRVESGGHLEISDMEDTGKPKTKQATKRLTIRAKIEPDGMTMTLQGRDAWALRELVNAGARGCTAIDNPGPRWSSYVFNLRSLGFVIETVHEQHKGDFPGNHARYVLHSQVTLEEPVEA